MLSLTTECLRNKEKTPSLRKLVLDEMLSGEDEGVLSEEEEDE